MEKFCIRPKKGTTPKVRPGVHEGTVIKVGATKNYAPGHAFTISYDVVEGNRHIKFDETILNDSWNHRTARFDRQLLANGFDPSDIDALVGTHWKLSFEFETDFGRSFLNIVERTHIPPPVQAEEVENAAP